MRPTCPICGKVSDSEDKAAWPHYPFCSDRCKLIDLGRWLREDYRIPTPPEHSEMPPPEDSDSQ
jgi:endogenous inhibitor of DNA gyrase (YacG/DUF329 family)